MVETPLARFCLRIASAFTLAFLYLPLAVIALYAFNERRIQTWPIPGLTLDWFGKAFRNPGVREALLTSVIVALLATAVAVVLGLVASLAVQRYRFFGRETISFIVILPIALPGIVTGMALNATFRELLSPLGFSLGLFTVVVGHATFCIVVIYNNAIARLRRVSRSFEEASMDLGADSWQTFRFVTLPSIRTALMAGALLAFALSFDEIVVTTFTIGVGQETLPIWIFTNLSRPNQLPIVNVVALLGPPVRDSRLLCAAAEQFERRRARRRRSTMNPRPAPVVTNTNAVLVVGALWIVLIGENILFDSLLTLGLLIVMLLLTQTVTECPRRTRTGRSRLVSEPGSVQLERVTKQFEDAPAVDDISLEIEHGSFFALLGPSGCGKTTTLRMIGGFEEPTAGRILLGGTDIASLPPYKRDVNTVFQSYALFPHLTIRDNIAFGLKRKGVKGDELKKRVDDALELVDLGALGKRKPKQISGGQQQRVALARALVNRPQVLLLDEPLGALDLKLRKQMQLELKGIQSEVGITFVHVTHDQEEAMTMADQIAVMRAGKIEQLGTPSELYERPQTSFVAGFLGTCNLLTGTVEGPGRLKLADGTVIQVNMDGASGSVSVGVRPEKVRLGDTGGNQLTGTVRETAYIGVATQVIVDTPSGGVTVFHQNTEAGGLIPAVGSQVTVSWPVDCTFIVDQGGGESS